MNIPLVDRAAVEKGQKYLRAWILRPWSKLLKIQKALTSAFSSSLGTLSVVSLSVKQIRNKNETHAVLSIVTNSSSGGLMYVQQVEANRVKSNNQKAMEKHGDPATAGLDSTAALNNWG